MSIELMALLYAIACTVIILSKIIILAGIMVIISGFILAVIANRKSKRRTYGPPNPRPKPKPRQPYQIEPSKPWERR